MVNTAGKGRAAALREAFAEQHLDGNDWKLVVALENLWRREEAEMDDKPHNYVRYTTRWKWRWT